MSDPPEKNGCMTDDFHKFPHTPHLIWLGSDPPRKDKILSPDEVSVFLNGTVIIEEKTDGANIGFSVGSDGKIRVQSRGRYIRSFGHSQFALIRKWIAEKQPAMEKALAPGLILFGEWCYARHSIYYDRLPDWFLAFDVYDSRRGEFWPVRRRNEFVKSLGLITVPFLDTGCFTRPELLKYIARSSMTDRQMEGIYLRKEKKDILAARAKIVRPEFMQSVGKHWTKRALEKNKLNCPAEQNGLYLAGERP